MRPVKVEELNVKENSNDCDNSQQVMEIETGLAIDLRLDDREFLLRWS